MRNSLLKIMKKSMVCLLATVVCVSFVLAAGDSSFATSKVKTPRKVSGLKATISEKKVITLKWKKAKGAKKYQVFLATKKKFKKQKTTKKCIFIYKGKPGGVYKFKVRGISGKKNGKFSKICTVKIPNTVVRYGIQKADDFTGIYQSALCYDMKVKVTLDKNKKIISVKDGGSTPQGASDVEEFKIFKKAKGYDIYKRKTIKEVKALEMHSWEKDYPTAGKDSVKGALRTSISIRLAVINAMEGLGYNPKSVTIARGNMKGRPNKAANGASLSYDTRLKVVIDKKTKRIIKLEDDGTEPIGNIYWYQKWWALGGDKPYIGKTLEEVKKLDMYSYKEPMVSHHPGPDAIAGATYTSVLAKCAVEQAMEKSNPFKKDVLKVVGITNGEKNAKIYFENKLPKGYKIQLDGLYQGTFNGEKKVSGAKLSKDGKILTVSKKLEPGYYSVNISDKGGKYPAFNEKYSHAAEYSYPYFVIKSDKSKVEWKGNKLSATDNTVENLVDNIKSIKVRDGMRVMSFVAPTRDENLDLNGEFYKNIKNNNLFNKDGSLNFNFTDPETGKKVIDAKGRYDIMVEFYGNGERIMIKLNAETVIKYGIQKADEDTGVPGSALPYDFKVKVTMEIATGRIIRVENDGTDPKSNPDNDTADQDAVYLKKYFDEGGLRKYRLKTLEEVKKMEMQDPNYAYNTGHPGVDAIAGATASSISARLAVINAMESSN